MFNVVRTCPHVDQVKIKADRDSVRGCEDCLKIGATWVHLRMCLTCGYVGCCEQSEHKHTRAHFRATQHPIVQSMEADEKWAYCYVDKARMNRPPAPVGA